MEKVVVKVEWCGDHYSATYGDNVPGAAVFTADTFDDLQKEAVEVLQSHVEVYQEFKPEELPQWLADGDYELAYEFKNTAAILRSIEQYASLAAISRVTGINQNLLSHYANGIKKPRPQQRQRIIDGIHTIGQRLLAF